MSTEKVYFLLLEFSLIQTLIVHIRLDHVVTLKHHYLSAALFAVLVTKIE